MVQGYLEYIQASRLYGWAFSQQDPGRRLAIEIRCGEEVLGRTTADVYRDDLLAASIGDGAHGFIFDLPQERGNADLQRLSAQAVAADGTLHPLERLCYTPLVAEISVPEASFPGAVSDASQYPVFVLGSARSGTSAMARALQASERYWGPNEGHVFDLFAHLSDSLRSFYDIKQRAGADNGATLLSQVPLAFLHGGLRHLFVTLVKTSMPTPWWFDKTPNHHMIHLAPQFKAIWPNAKFIFMKRRALEFIESRRRKFPEMSFETNCREWVVGMSAWNGVRERLGAHALEVDQLIMVRQPAGVVAAVTPFTKLNTVEAERFKRSLADDRPEQTADIFAPSLRLEDMSWTAAERRVFDEVCMPMMDAAGYSTDETYRRHGGPHRWLWHGIGAPDTADPDTADNVTPLPTKPKKAAAR